MASLSGPVHVAFDTLHGLRSCDVPITRLNHTPHATAVYASWPASPSAHATLASRLPAGHYLGLTFTDGSRQLCLAPSQSRAKNSGRRAAWQVSADRRAKSWHCGGTHPRL